MGAHKLTPYQKNDSIFIIGKEPCEQFIKKFGHPINNGYIEDFENPEHVGEHLIKKIKGIKNPKRIVSLLDSITEGELTGKQDLSDGEKLLIKEVKEHKKGKTLVISHDDIINYSIIDILKTINADFIGFNQIIGFKKWNEYESLFIFGVPEIDLEEMEKLTRTFYATSPIELLFENDRTITIIPQDYIHPDSRVQEMIKQHRESFVIRAVGLFNESVYKNKTKRIVRIYNNLKIPELNI